MRISYWASPLLVLLVAGESVFAATPLTDERSVRVQGYTYYIDPRYGTRTETEEHPPAFAPWTRTVQNGFSHGAQTSSIDDSLAPSLTLTARGEVGATSFVPIAGYGRVFDGDSEYTVTFRVDEPSTYALSGTLQAELDLGSIDAGARLTGPSGLIHEATISTETSLALDRAGPLQPGTYVFEVWARANARGFLGYSPEAFGDFDATLVVATIEPPVVPAVPPLALFGLVLALPASVLVRRSLR